MKTASSGHIKKYYSPNKHDDKEKLMPGDQLQEGNVSRNLRYSPTYRRVAMKLNSDSTAHILPADHKNSVLNPCMQVKKITER